MKQTNIYFWSYRAQIFLEWEVFESTVIKNVKTRSLYSVTIFQKSWFLWDNVEKYSRTGQATYENMAHAHFILGT